MSRGGALRSGTPAREAVQGAATAIAAAGCESPRLDAELLVAAVLDVPRERIVTDRSLEVRGAAVRELQAAVARRAADREPLAYILGRRHFRDIELRVDRRALVPRPETELLVEVALALAPGARVLDVGTGSGAVALALARERPDLEVSASDASEDALALARENAQRLRLPVCFLHADLLAGVPDRYDAVLSNPPYVADREIAALAPEIARHEPRSALAGGADGLAVVRRLIAQLGARGRVAMAAIEVGQGQGAAAVGLLERAGLTGARCVRDLAGIERVVLWRRPDAADRERT